ncbi:conserved domain protein [Streptococcus constellatus subsp. pharyngis SK1060 = CCUG 46377]|uniref:Conserved domain protein n=1 Tax=Streptococcus constellatus subsp. pharyngis SK1060 = CCUG 46377 TaxID=1035184 RepID=F9P5P1_STRCV|nr:conserved domain protein [Streptococcus constellatus subsp. pharyngis SK1060 = CCUG 46377]
MLKAPSALAKIAPTVTNNMITTTIKVNFSNPVFSVVHYHQKPQYYLYVFNLLS